MEETSHRRPDPNPARKGEKVLAEVVHALARSEAEYYQALMKRDRVHRVESLVDRAYLNEIVGSKCGRDWPFGSDRLALFAALACRR